MKKSCIFPRHTEIDEPVAVAGDGCYLIDAQGRRYFDASGGVAVSCLGHGDTEIIDAIQAQLACLAYSHSGFFTSQPAEQLAELLIEHAPVGLSRVYPVSGGSEAVEAALKLARQFQLERGRPERHRIISRRQSFHGNTLGALSAGGNMMRRDKYTPYLFDSIRIPPCYAYRERREDETEHQYGIRAADALEDAIIAAGPETVMAFIAEPVVGATLGAVPAVPGYFPRIREICDRYEVLLILDEIMCGMGRTGTLFACQQDAVVPDICVIGKGLGGGYQPIAAMLCREEILTAIRDGSGFFQHGHTYMAHPTGCAGALAVLRAIFSRNLLENVVTMGDRLAGALRERFAQHPHIGDIRGRGLFWGLELVADRETQEPFDPARMVHARVRQAAFEAGMICYPMGGTIDGKRGDHVLIAPPYIISAAEIDMLVDRLEVAITTAIVGGGPN